MTELRHPSAVLRSHLPHALWLLAPSSVGGSIVLVRTAVTPPAGSAPRANSPVVSLVPRSTTGYAAEIPPGLTHTFPTLRGIPNSLPDPLLIHAKLSITPEIVLSPGAVFHCVRRMAQIQRMKQSGEVTQTFLQFVLMQTQQALFALGKHPNMPPTAPPPNLNLGKMYVDHLVMLRIKTDGNLSMEETNALNNAIGVLQGALTEAMKEAEQGRATGGEMEEEE